MKRFFCLLTVLAFVGAGSMVMAQGKAAPPMKSATKTVNCCVKGKCTQVGTSADCAKKGGKAVRDCKDCK